ncbi:MAG: hypothetical protein IJZ61_05005 [Oscillospiraceae bacterium]|nr:hypothetical protein [Oscillospiraceae bacterium]
MNMKKTMAAIAAGAVAVSAMATTVSALEDATLPYSLVKEDTIYGANWKNGTGTMQFKITATATEAAAEEAPEAPEAEATIEVKCDNAAVTVSYTDDVKAGTYKYADKTFKWVVPTTFTDAAVKSATAPAKAPADANATETYTAQVFTNDNGTPGDTSDDTTVVKWVDAAGNDVTANVTLNANATPANGATIDLTATADKDAGWYDADGNAMPKSLAVTGGEDKVKAGDTITVTITEPTVDDAPVVDEVVESSFPTKIEIMVPYYDTDASEKENWKPSGQLKNLVLKVMPTNVAEQGNTYVYSTDATAASKLKIDDSGLATLNLTNELEGLTGSVILTVTADYECWGDMADEAKFKNVIKNKSFTITTDEPTEISDVMFAGYTASTSDTVVVRKPFKSTLEGSTNILAYLDGTMGYKNVKAVVNDAIETYDSVTFKFNTASEKIGYVVDDKWTEVYTDGWWDGCNAAGSYKAALKAVDGDADRLTAIYTDKDGATDEFKGFAQHLYTNYYDPDSTKYEGFDWSGYNLFQGALIVNEDLTMSLSQFDYFDWNETSLMFDWDAIMDCYEGGITENDFALYLHSMRLATSNTWYWDNLVIECTAAAGDDASSDAGVDGDGATLDDTNEGGEGDITAPSDDDETKADPEPAPAPDVANPITGNASVALAVIPVALAAAAVVAKKRS